MTKTQTEPVAAHEATLHDLRDVREQAALIVPVLNHLYDETGENTYQHAAEGVLRGITEITGAISNLAHGGRPEKRRTP